MVGMAVVPALQGETPSSFQAEEARLSACNGDLAAVDGSFDLILADLKSECFLPTCSEDPEGQDPAVRENGPVATLRPDPCRPVVTLRPGPCVDRSQRCDLIRVDRSQRCDLVRARFDRYALIGLFDVLGQLVFGGSIEAF
ncbi:hypothetical protein F2Q69_00022725 [Brassica cretica]|uniref:Uncharacterized protein n=1 Tax=Brassica cretica TaxID=69181 RepID=A0A8S9Q926_BRACR|nr:hypothetical protein F2Q69_00022725 [Brassica cretica]